SSSAAAGLHWSVPAASTAAAATSRSCPDNPGTSATYPATRTSTPAPNTDTATATPAANAPSQTRSRGHAPGGHSESITAVRSASTGTVPGRGRPSAMYRPRSYTSTATSPRRTTRPRPTLPRPHTCSPVPDGDTSTQVGG